MKNVKLQIDLIANALLGAADGILLIVPLSNTVKIAVIVVSVAFFVAICLITILYLRRRKEHKRQYTELPNADSAP
jgi:Flp pilus assembly protein TadB